MFGGIHWDGSISLGTLLEAVSVLFVGFKLSGRLAQIELKVETMWKEYTEGK